METLVRDLRQGWRSLMRAPGFTITAALTLALGIGANTAIFSVVDGVLLRPLPFEAPDRLASIWAEHTFARGNYDLLNERARSFDALAGVGFGASRTVSGEGEPVRVEANTATATLLSTLGVQPELGRGFMPDEELPAGEAVVMLSHEFWRTRYSGDPRAVGATTLIDGRPHTIIGVMPAGFALFERGIDLWLPALRNPSDINSYWSGSGSLRVIGRLRPDVDIATASAEVRALGPEFRDAYPWDMPTDFGSTANAIPLSERLVGDVRTLLLVLLGAVGLVLLVACANVANLALVRATGRARELAVRAALGAGRRRIARQLFAESLLLGALGFAAGVVLAVWATSALVSLLPPDMPRTDTIGIDLRVLAFALAATLVTVFLFGIVPALRASRTDLAHALRGRGDDHGVAARTLSAALVVAEVALAVVLVTAAGLVLRSLDALLRVDPGFETEHVMTATVAPPDLRYGDAASRSAFYDELTLRLEALPGVRTASVADRLPFGGRNYGSVFLIEGRSIPQGGDWPWADVRAAVGESYLDDLDIDIIDGRGFNASDDGNAIPVAIISRSVARTHWPEGNAVGQRIRFPVPADRWITIVGIAEDVKWNGLGEETLGALYVPRRQSDIANEARVIVVASGPGDAIASSLREVVASIDDATPVADIQTLDQRVAGSAAQPRFATAILGLFAFLALALGSVGIYGVISYAVGRRTREFGIRMALGARAAEVRRLVLSHGLRLALLGLAFGLAGALAASRALRGLLYGIRPADPLTFTLVPLLLVAVALLASWVPARRATATHPMYSLRNE